MRASMSVPAKKKIAVIGLINV